MPSEPVLTTKEPPPPPAREPRDLTAVEREQRELLRVWQERQRNK